MDNEDVITRWCKISIDDVMTLNKYFAKQPIAIQLRIFAMHREILFRSKEKMKEDSIAINTSSYISMLLSIKYYYALEKKLTKVKFEDLSFDELRDISMIQLEKFDAKFMQRGKRNTLRHYWSIVKLCKSKKIGSRKISKYLAYKHKFKISHTEICKAWNKLENMNISK